MKKMVLVVVLDGWGGGGGGGLARVSKNYGTLLEKGLIDKVKIGSRVPHQVSLEPACG